jgi:hypothetical protein
MSDVKPEETLVAPVEVAAPVPEPAADALPAIAGGEAPAAAEADTPAEDAPKTEEAAEEKKEEETPKEEKPEPKAITHGTIYKTHAGLLSYVTLNPSAAARQLSVVSALAYFYSRVKQLLQDETLLLLPGGGHCRGRPADLPAQGQRFQGYRCVRSPDR